MILNQRPGDQIGVALDRAVDAGRLSAHDAEQVETFSEFLTYAGKPGPGSTRAQLRWLAAWVRTERGRVFFLGSDDRAAAEEYAGKLERAAAWRT